MYLPAITCLPETPMGRRSLNHGLLNKKRPNKPHSIVSIWSEVSPHITKEDYASAAALLKPLADKGISRAQFRIAYMHFLGRGFPENRNEADRIIRAALPAIQAFAAEGRAWAQSDLGSLYEDGLVLPRDYKEAFFWYRASAEQGYAGAQTNLGILYARGLGVSSFTAHSN